MQPKISLSCSATNIIDGPRSLINAKKSGERFIRSPISPCMLVSAVSFSRALLSDWRASRIIISFDSNGQRNTDPSSFGYWKRITPSGLHNVDFQDSPNFQTEQLTLL